MGFPKLRSIFDTFLVPTWLHSASQNPPKTLQKTTPRGIKILIDFCFDFFSILAPFWNQLGAMLAPKTPPRRPQDGPRCPARTRPGFPERDPHAQRHPKTPQDAPKAPKTLPRRRFWKDLGEMLENFGKIFGRLFGKILLSNMPPQTYFRKTLPPQIRFPKKPI